MRKDRRGHPAARLPFLAPAPTQMTGCTESHAQSTSGVSPPAFEVASVKAQPWTGEGSVGLFTLNGNTLTVEHADLYTLIDFASGLKTDDTQISGGPGWARHGALAASDLYRVVGPVQEPSRKTRG